MENLRITTFDPHVCAKLYNVLVDKALGLNPQLFNGSESLPSSDYRRFPDHSRTDSCSPSLLTFLRDSQLYPTHSPDACLMPFVQPLDPKAFWLYESWRKPEQNPSAICLFAIAPYMDDGGLFFDQDTGLARYVRFPGPWPDDHLWMPLELVLRKWVRMWDLGQIGLNSEDECRLDWVANAVCELDLTIDAWHKLLEAITSRMPSDAFSTASATNLTLLQSVAVYVDPIDQTYTFAKDFLERARRPSLLRSGNVLRVAPGLTITSESDTGPSAINTRIIFPVAGSNVDCNCNGIHLTQDAYPCMDHVAYYVASPSGRLAQKKLFQPWDTKNRYTHCPWNGMRRLRLIDVLRIWTRCIQDGRWVVGTEGVEGSLADLEAAGSGFAKLSWETVDL